MATVAPAAVIRAEIPATRTSTRDREPALAVHQAAEHQPGRPAEDPGRGHPPDPRGIGAAAVHHRAQQAAHRAQESRGLAPQGVSQGERPADGERGADHRRPRHRGRDRPDHLGEPWRDRGRGGKLGRLPHPGPAGIIGEDGSPAHRVKRAGIRRTGTSPGHRPAGAGPAWTARPASARFRPAIAGGRPAIDADGPGRAARVAPDRVLPGREGRVHGRVAGGRPSRRSRTTACVRPAGSRSRADVDFLPRHAGRGDDDQRADVAADVEDHAARARRPGVLSVTAAPQDGL